MVVGLGNEFRRDDAIGLLAARRLREQGMAAEEHDGDLSVLIDRWDGADGLVLIDAVSSGAAPGTLHRFDLSASPLPLAFRNNSTHALGLAEAVELSRALGTLPARVFVLGIEAQDFTAGLGLSPEVYRALPALLIEVFSCMKSFRGCDAG